MEVDILKALLEKQGHSQSPRRSQRERAAARTTRRGVQGGWPSRSARRVRHAAGGGAPWGRFGGVPGPLGVMSDRYLLTEIRDVLATSPFVGEGHRKVWARLRRRGVCARAASRCCA